MKQDSVIQRRITQLTARLCPALVTGVWIVRAASPGYAPAYEQLGIADMLPPVREDDPQTPWHALTRASGRARLSALTEALHAITPNAPALRELEALPPLTVSEEGALEELIELLSGLSPGSLSRFYPLRDSPDPSLPVYGDYDVPLCVLRLLLSVLGIQSGSSLYDPCYGSGALLSRAAGLLPHEKKLGFWGQAMEPGAYQLCHVHGYLSGVTLHFGEKWANTLLEDLFEGQEFDCILAHPPFNQPLAASDGRLWPFGVPPRSNANFGWLQHVFSHLTPEGHAAVILPNGTLTTQTQSERAIRMGLLEKGVVEAIIALPAGLLPATKAPCCIWLLAGERSETSTTLFVDAQGLDLTGDMTEDMLTLGGLILHHRLGLPTPKTHWYGEADLSEIQQRDYLLSPNFYTLPLPPQIPTQNLPLLSAQISELLPQLAGSELHALLKPWRFLTPESLWKPISLSLLCQITGGIVKKKEAFGHGVPMADVTTVIHSPFLPESLPAMVEVTPEEMEKYRIRAGDIFMNRSSESVEALACCCVALSDREAVYGGYLKRLRPLGEPRLDPRYLAAYFRSAVYRQEIARVSPVYTIRSNINRRQLAQVSVYYPSPEMQEKIGQTYAALWQFQHSCSDPVLAGKLRLLSELFIEQFISCPISRYASQS